MGASGWGEWRVITNDHGVSSWGDENVRKLTVVIVAQLYEYTKNHPIVYFKWVVNCMVCELSLNKAIIGFPGGAVVKNPPANAGDTGLSPGPGRSHMPWSN